MSKLSTTTVPIVIDPGSYRWRVGYANAQKPRSSFVTDISALKTTAVEEDGEIKRFEWTDLSLAYFERYVKHGLRVLNADPSNTSLCLAVPLAFTSAYRNQLAEVLLERIGAKSMFMASQPLLSGFSSGQPSCLVVDSGYTYTSIYGIHDLYPQRYTESIYFFGGRDIDTYLKSLIGTQLEGCTLSAIDYMKSHFCSVASAPLSASTGERNGTTMQSYQMPDGQCLKLGDELQLAPELIFSPKLNGHTKTRSIEAVIWNAARQLPEEKSTEVLRHVVLSGGNLKFQGLDKRLTVALGNSDVMKHPVGELGVWCGGAIFASMSTFPSMVITKERWKEYGEKIVQMKWL